MLQEELLKQLADIHNKKREEIWEVSHNVEKTLERIEDGCQFVERVLTNGNSTEVLTMKKLISNQLMSLIQNTPNADINVKINFHVDQEEFEDSLKKTLTFKEEVKQAKEETQLIHHDLAVSYHCALCYGVEKFLKMYWHRALHIFIDSGH